MISHFVGKVETYISHAVLNNSTEKIIIFGNQQVTGSYRSKGMVPVLLDGIRGCSGIIEESVDRGGCS
jgi:hypothetical protein